jgi:hypothetical protein
MKTGTTSFTKTIAEMNAGASLVDLSQAMEQLIAAVRQTGKKGSLTYRLDVKPASEGDVVTVMLTDDISTKLPKAARATSLFFTTEENGLQRSDPRQVEMDLKVVAPKAEEAPRRVAEATA